MGIEGGREEKEREKFKSFPSIKCLKTKDHLGSLKKSLQVFRKPYKRQMLWNLNLEFLASRTLRK